MQLYRNRALGVRNVPRQINNYHFLTAFLSQKSIGSHRIFSLQIMNTIGQFFMNLPQCLLLFVYSRKLFYFLSAVSVYGTKNFSMSITFPKLNYSLFAELTSNIEDFIFMEITGVTVRKDSNVHYNGTATPQYFSTKNNGKNDRVLVNFGYIKVISLH